jgi:hypothetical protein
MNFSLWIGIFFFILLCHLRFRAYAHQDRTFSSRRRWLFMAGYILLALIPALLFVWAADAGMRELSLISTEAALNFGGTSTNRLAIVAQLYFEHANPLLLLIGALAAAEVIVILSRIFAKSDRAATSNTIESHETSRRQADSFRNYGLATLLAFFAGPILGFSLASLDSNDEHIFSHQQDSGSMSISYIISPILALYAAPAHWLDMSATHQYRQRGDTFFWSPSYPSNKPLTLTNLADDSAPWLILCLIITVAATVKGRERLSGSPPSVRQLLVGELDWRDAWRSRHWHALPWRGRLLYGTSASVFGLALIATILQRLPYDLTAFSYGGWVWIFLIAGIFAIIAPGRANTGAVTSSTPDNADKALPANVDAQTAITRKWEEANPYRAFYTLMFRLTLINLVVCTVLMSLPILGTFIAARLYESLGCSGGGLDPLAACHVLGVDISWRFSVYYFPIIGIFISPIAFIFGFYDFILISLLLSFFFYRLSKR